MPGLKANLVALRLYDPWKLIDFVEIDGALHRVLQHQQLFDFNDILQRVWADELTVTLKQQLQHSCRRYRTVAPSSCASFCEASPERSQSGNGKAKNEGANRGTDLASLVKPKYEYPHQIKELPARLLEAAEVLKEKHAKEGAKLTEFQLRPFVVAAQHWCLESGVVNKEATPLVLAKVAL